MQDQVAGFKQAEEILVALNFPESVISLLSEPFREGLSLYPMAGFVALVNPKEELYPRVQVTWLGRKFFTGLWYPNLALPSDPELALLRVRFPKNYREARTEAIYSFVFSRREETEGCWTERMLQRLENVTRRLLSPKGFLMPLRLTPEEKRGFRSRCLIHLYEGKIPGLPLWIWRGEWKPVHSWQVSQEDIPVIRLFPWVDDRLRGAGSGFFISPLGALQDNQRLSPREVLERQGLDPSWAERVEMGNREAIEALKELAAQDLLMRLLGEGEKHG